jgi:hypothetical protein
MICMDVRVEDILERHAQLTDELGVPLCRLFDRVDEDALLGRLVVEQVRVRRRRLLKELAKDERAGSLLALPLHHRL